MHIKTIKIKNKTYSKRRKIFNFFADNKVFTILVFVLLLGIIFGNFVFKNLKDGLAQKISDLFLTNIRIRLTGTFFSVFTDSIFTTFIFVLVIFLMGLSAWGVTLIPLVVFLKGYCSGVLQNYLFIAYGAKGILYEFLILFPGFFISSIATILMAKEAIKISNIFSNLLLNVSNNQTNEKYVKNYLLKTGCVLILTVLAAFADVLFNFLFLRFFSF